MPVVVLQHQQTQHDRQTVRYRAAYAADNGCVLELRSGRWVRHTESARATAAVDNDRGRGGRPKQYTLVASTDRGDANERRTDSATTPDQNSPRTGHFVQESACPPGHSLPAPETCSKNLLTSAGADMPL